MSIQESGEALIEDVLNAVEARGFWVGAGKTQECALRTIQGLGVGIYETKVRVKPESKALVTSDRAIPFHTDHHRADLICWHCLEQTDQGGETLLLDAYLLLSRLHPEQIAALQSLQLPEHRVFPEDTGSFPVLSEHYDRQKVYYASWLLGSEHPQEQVAALETFRRLTEQQEPIVLRLQPGDVLVIDNGRMLHGRTAIDGNKRRWLNRYWIERFTKGDSYACT